jgi:flagellar hook-basal body complex protein FliE
MSGFDLPPITGWDVGSRPKPADLAGLGDVLLRPDGPVGRVRPELGGDDAAATRPFSGVLADSLDRVRDLQLDVREKVQGLVLGEEVELHDVLIAGSKSEVAFNLLLEVRNKLVDAWEQLSRSSV